MRNHCPRAGASPARRRCAGGSGFSQPLCPLPATQCLPRFPPFEGSSVSSLQRQDTPWPDWKEQLPRAPGRRRLGGGAALPGEQEKQPGADPPIIQQATAQQAAGAITEHAHHAGKPPLPQHMGLLSGSQASLADVLIPPQGQDEP